MVKKSIKLFFAISFVALIFSSCGDIENSGDNTIGNNLVSSEVLQDVNSSTNLYYIKVSGIDVNATSAFAYRVVKIIYNTKDEQNNDVKASGVLVYPVVNKAFLDYFKQVKGKNFSISTILENHGTIFTNDEAPSNSIKTPGTGDQGLAVLMTAKAGFAVAMPDYLGYGESNDKPHPYILKKSSARVSIDMLRASTRYMNDNNILLNGQVYISGYSEGGYVAMATAKEIEENYSDEFNLKGVAPMAGPYDVKGLANRELDANRTMEYPAFLAFLASSYSLNYDSLDLKDILVKATNDANVSMINNLFNGNNNSTVIQVSLGLTNYGGYKVYKANSLFKDSFINGYKNNMNNLFKKIAEKNSVYDWKPKGKMNLIHCIDDEIIPFSMAQTAYNTFIQNGDDNTTITLTPIPTSYIHHDGLFIHGDCGSTAYGVAVSWFDKIRSGDIK